jgi:hypothetical protein
MQRATGAMPSEERWAMSISSASGADPGRVSEKTSRWVGRHTFTPSVKRRGGMPVGDEENTMIAPPRST